jgi:putative MATE family efflux protein
MAPILHTWLGTDPLVFDQAVLYLRIFACGMIANLVFNYLASMLRATGNTVVPLIILCVSGLVNVGLNLLLVTQFGMSVDGVAIATVTAQVLSMVAMLIYYVHRKDYLHFSFRKLCLAPDKLKKILRIGIPAGLQSSLFALSNSVIQSGVNSFGATAMAGNAASAQVGNLVYILLNAFYHAAMNFVGQNYAARKFDRVKKTILYCTIFVTAIGVSVSTVILLFGAQAIRIFNSDPAVIEYGLIRLTSVLPVYFLCGIMDSLNGTLRGMGSSTLPMFITLAGSCGLRLVWIWTVFQKIHTLRCLYLCWPISWVVTAVALFCGVVIIYRNRKKEALARDSSPVSA